MILLLLIFIPLIGGFFSWQSQRIGEIFPRLVSLFFLTLNFFLIFKIFFKNNFFISSDIKNSWNEEICIPWIKDYGINLHLGMDSLSWLMIFLTIFLSLISVLLTWNEDIKNIGFFLFLIMFMISNMIGIFLSLDLFLFFIFWEVISIPIYFLIVYWGRKTMKRKKNIVFANKYLIYSQISGLTLLISILFLVINYYDFYHIWTFDFDILKSCFLNKNIEHVLMFGFLVSFFIKLPVVPFHSWFPNFHKNTPISGSFDLIGIVIKTSIYSLLRFNLFLFPRSSYFFSKFFCFLGLFSIFYGIFLVFSQTSIKKIIAYTSISHMGFILIAIYSGTLAALQGVFIQIISYSLSTSGLIILTRILYRNFKTDNFKKMSGLWKKMSYVPGFFLFFVMSHLGIPGTGNFSGEYLILFGSFQRYPEIVVCSMIGLIISSICLLGVFHRIFYGKSNFYDDITYQISILEFLILFLFIFLLIFIGLFPNFLLKIFNSSITNITKIISPFTI
jgi:NADH-quinone oxidoreductase subunit M